MKEASRGDLVDEKSHLVDGMGGEVHLFKGLLSGLMGVVFVATLVSSHARAACMEGPPQTCTGVNGCSGTRECNGRSWTRCECEPVPPIAVPCVNSCGVAGTLEAGVCRATEVCNTCDDDGDGMTNEGLKCAHLSLQPRCTSTASFDAEILANDSIGTGSALMYAKWGLGFPLVPDTRSTNAATYPARSSINWRFLASAASYKTVLKYQGVQFESGTRLMYSPSQCGLRQWIPDSSQRTRDEYRADRPSPLLGQLR